MIMTGDVTAYCKSCLSWT